MKYYLVKIKIHRELPKIERLFKAETPAQAIAQAKEFIEVHEYDGAEVVQVYEKVWDILSYMMP